MYNNDKKVTILSTKYNVTLENSEVNSVAMECSYIQRCSSVRVEAFFMRCSIIAHNEKNLGVFRRLPRRFEFR